MTLRIRKNSCVGLRTRAGYSVEVDPVGPRGTVHLAINSVGPRRIWPQRDDAQDKQATQRRQDARSAGQNADALIRGCKNDHHIKRRQNTKPQTHHELHQQYTKAEAIQQGLSSASILCPTQFYAEHRVKQVLSIAPASSPRRDFSRGGLSQRTDEAFQVLRQLGLKTQRLPRHRMFKPEFSRVQCLPPERC